MQPALDAQEQGENMKKLETPLRKCEDLPGHLAIDSSISRAQTHLRCPCAVIPPEHFIPMRGALLRGAPHEYFSAIPLSISFQCEGRSEWRSSAKAGIHPIIRHSREGGNPVLHLVDVPPGTY